MVLYHRYTFHIKFNVHVTIFVDAGMVYLLAGEKEIAIYSQMYVWKVISTQYITNINHINRKMCCVKPDILSHQYAANLN